MINGFKWDDGGVARNIQKYIHNRGAVCTLSICVLHSKPIKITWVKAPKEVLDTAIHIKVEAKALVRDFSIGCYGKMFQSIGMLLSRASIEYRVKG